MPVDSSLVVPDNLGVGHWYLFNNQNRVGSWNRCLELAANEKTFGKQLWHEHRYGEECVPECRIIDPEKEKAKIEPEATG